jgi:NADP-dependent 3-hydroxy acid dehydrogenase YdfG
MTAVQFSDQSINRRRGTRKMAVQPVLITGTSKGIGYETALAFSRAGYHVHAMG